MWLAYSTSPDEMHIIPNNDLIEHTQDEGCVCGPTEKEVGDNMRMFLHASLDGRELNEPDWKG